jgi:hypothetical protein
VRQLNTDEQDSFDKRARNKRRNDLFELLFSKVLDKQGVTSPQASEPTSY